MCLRFTTQQPLTARDIAGLAGVDGVVEATGTHQGAQSQDD